jgi:hypothetical protein
MIKKYWYIPVIGILLALISFQQSCYNKLVDEKIAGIAREQVMQRETAKQTALTDAYRKANSILTAENKKIKDDMVVLGITADTFHTQSEQRRIALQKIKDCPQRADGLNLQLIACNEFTLKLKLEYTDGINDLNLSCEKMIKSKDDEIRALNASWGETITDLGDCTKALVIAQQKAKRITNLGFFAGYDFLNNKFSAGVGLTIDIIKFKLPGFLGGIL